MMSAAEVKNQVVPLEFYEGVLTGWRPRRDRGWVDGGICPFHDDKRPGSFKVSLSSGAFKCFSCGASGGSVIDFIMVRDGVDFRTALRVIAESCGMFR